MGTVKPDLTFTEMGEVYKGKFICRIANHLCNAGCRKASEVAREMCADFQSILFSIMYFGNDGKYHLRKMSADKVTLSFEKYFELQKKYTEEGK